MARWTARTWVDAAPDDVLSLLTEADAIARWSPFPFEVVDWDGARLEAGDSVRVAGRLGGRALECTPRSR